MLHGTIDGVSRDDSVAQFTHERIRAFAAETPTVYRVAHDPETPLAWATAAPSLLAFEDGRMNARETGLMTGQGPVAPLLRAMSLPPAYRPRTTSGTDAARRALPSRAPPVAWKEASPR
jgi:hypothetical protein